MHQLKVRVKFHPRLTGQTLRDQTHLGSFWPLLLQRARHALILSAKCECSKRTASQHILEYTAERELHERYKIDAVPTVLMADANGVVQANFLGPVSATDLWAALARARDSVV